MLVCFDFDGVINSYTSGWIAEDVIPDPPVKDIVAIMTHLLCLGYTVAVFSSRCATDKGFEAVKKYMEQWEIPYSFISRTKPPAFVTIDDRCICFDGTTDTLIDQIQAFKPWYHKGDE